MVALEQEPHGPAQRFRRHVPPLLFLLAVTALIIAIAGPNAVITLPSQQQTIVMAMDVSLSMGAKDVDPNRITRRRIAYNPSRAAAFFQSHFSITAGLIGRARNSASNSAGGLPMRNAPVP